jgi:hypothetical protein
MKKIFIFCNIAIESERVLRSQMVPQYEELRAVPIVALLTSSSTGLPVHRSVEKVEGIAVTVRLNFCKKDT